MASVELKNVSKRFADGTRPVWGVDLRIEDGELIVLLGSSGCGKTTLLRMLAGLEAVTEGEVRIGGKRVNEMPPQQRNVAMVFQNYALYPHMTVRANLEFPLRMAHTPRESIASRVAEIAAILQLQELMERKPAQLSGGQRQRVAMGRALVRNPSLFLLDEPLSNLDAGLRAHIREQIADIQQRLATTTLYVTHDQVEAMTLGDRVVVLDQGQVRQVGTPQELYQRPQNIFVAKFIGSPGMNILQSSLEDRGAGELAVRFGGQHISLVPRAQRYAELASYTGQDLYTGIRPEALDTVPARSDVRLQVRVESREYLGHETLTRLSLPGAEPALAGQALFARVQGSWDARIGDEAVIYLDPAALHFFDRSGQSIL